MKRLASFLGIFFVSCGVGCGECRCKQHTPYQVINKDNIKIFGNDTTKVLPMRSIDNHYLTSIRYQDEGWAKVAYVYDNMGMFVTKVLNPSSVELNGTQIGIDK